MTKSIRATAALILIPAGFAVAGCGGSGHQSSANGDVAQPSAATPAAAPAAAPEHHSKLAGAAVGAIAGHELGGHAVAGAVVGAAIQHHRNKKAR